MAASFEKNNNVVIIDSVFKFFEIIIFGGKGGGEREGE